MRVLRRRFPNLPRTMTTISADRGFGGDPLRSPGLHLQRSQNLSRTTFVAMTGFSARAVSIGMKLAW
jgi:hypothetical protein